MNYHREDVHIEKVPNGFFLITLDQDSPELIQKCTATYKELQNLYMLLQLVLKKNV